MNELPRCIYELCVSRNVKTECLLKYLNVFGAGFSFFFFFNFRDIAIMYFMDSKLNIWVYQIIWAGIIRSWL